MLHPGGARSLERAEPGIQIAETYLDITRLVLSPTGARLGTVAVRVSLARENAAFGSVRRRIFWLASGLSALSAEGRLSAIVLIALPIVVFLFLVVVQPTYFSAFFQNPLGIVALVVAVVLLIIGSIWTALTVRVKF